MKAPDQIPRNALVWIIISMFALLAPHLGRIPLWIVFLYAFTAFWRVMVYAGRWSFPGRAVKFLLVSAGFAGIFFSYGNVLGLEPTVALLLIAFAFKLIELAGRKDAYVLLFLGYFICITQFLFSQDILLVVYVLFCVVLVTTALIALHQPGEHSFNRRTIRVASVMLAQAFPLMLVLFFLFPRLGPLWSVPIKTNTATTGVSDFMKPGDISSLGKSDEVAFRAQFDGKIPDRSDLYWRGLVFSRIMKGAWTGVPHWEVPIKERGTALPVELGERLDYTVIMEPTQQNWLFSLRHAQPLTPGMLAAADHRLFSPVEIEDDLRYEVISWTESPLDTNISEWRRAVELKLPGQDNPRTRALGRALREEFEDNAALVDEVLRRFRQEPYVYTLNPPLLGSDPMDEFLFDTRRGFCEHYASAFVTLMRAAGVPARVVAGYQGGEINPVNRTVIVHQFDAHAWAEVWLSERGWVRVDPTAAVAPDRIELGLEQAVEAGSFLQDTPLSPLRFRGVVWVNSLRLQYDALTYRWQSWVTGFNSETQLDLLEDWFGEVDPRKYVAILIGTWLLVMIPVALTLLLRSKVRPRQPAERYYLAFCRRMADRGVHREPGETPDAFAERASMALPDYREEIYRVTGLYMQLAYSRGSEADDLLAQLKSAISPWSRLGLEAR
ncbi:MAG: DUF3488 and transglutaminase-like domain-containing protein [Pseudomonadota bacterium]